MSSINNINQNINLRQITQNLTINGMNNTIKIQKNNRKIILNGMNNSLQIRENNGVVVVNGMNSSVIIQIQGRNSRIFDNSMNSNVVTPPQRTNNRRRQVVISSDEEEEEDYEEDSNYGYGSHGGNFMSLPQQQSQRINIPNFSMSINGQNFANVMSQAFSQQNFNFPNNFHQNFNQNQFQGYQANNTGQFTSANHTHYSFNSESEDDDIEEDPDTNCVICAHDFHKRSKKAAFLECFHWFHFKCIDLWFKNKKECPICRHGTEHIHRQTSPLNQE